jgi:cytochrome c551/c552
LRRLVFLLVLAAVAAGCSSTVPGGKHVTTPTPVTVIGPLPNEGPTGHAQAGKAVFTNTGCGSCHTFTPAATGGMVGPNLDHLPVLAKAANQGNLVQFTTTSILDPGAYIAPGYPAGVMPSNYGQLLKAQQLADLVAFLVAGSVH